MSDAPINIFISYARTDMKFVDQLEEDLRMRSFDTWVDRHKLEGGRNWLNDIQQAIEQCQILLVALSPDAVKSEYVLMEYRYAARMGKSVIPIQYRSCPKVPIDLNDIQWIDFTQLYSKGLGDLLAVLAHAEKTSFNPQPISPVPVPVPVQTLLVSKEDEYNLVAPQPAPPPPEPSSDELYRDGLKARSSGDLERAVAIWQQIFDRDPNFKDGTFTLQRVKLLERLHPQRVARLQEIAEEVSRTGEWNREISAWEALLRLEPNNKRAQRRLNLARKHQKSVWHYENALRFVKEEQLSLARTELEMLWDEIPYYGDPACLARELGLPERDSKPKDYDEAVEHREKQARKQEKQTERQEEGITSKTTEHFIKYKLRTNFLQIRLALFCLLSGIGSAAGMLTHSPLWSVGTVVGIAILAYALGYRRIIHFLIVIGIVFVSSIIAFGTAEYGSTLAITQHSANFWFIASGSFWDGSQLDCGLFTGASTILILFIILKANHNPNIIDFFFTIATLAVVIIAALIVWAIVLLVSTLADWGFGFGPGWYISLIGLMIGVVGGLGLVSLWIVFLSHLRY